MAVRLLSLLVTAAVLVPAHDAHARRSVPAGWAGMVVDPLSLGRGHQAAREWNRMVASGVESVRVAFHWSTAQPYTSPAAVPRHLQHAFSTRGPNGMPLDFRATDSVVRNAASRSIRLLPVVLAAPRWAAADPGSPVSRPRDPTNYASYLTALVGRYGPHGRFWSLNPRVARMPIRQWQVWNEPEVAHFWSDTAWPSSYVALLRAARNAIKRADPGAKVVLAGLTRAAWYDPAQSLEKLYAAGARGLFDVAAVHPYTHDARNVVPILETVRRVMSHHGDGHKALMATEISWASALGRSDHDFGINVSTSDQADRIKQALPALAHERRALNLTSVYWYSWATTERGRGDPFAYAGLRKRGTPDSRAKPAFGAWRAVVLGLEGCRRPKRSVFRC